MEQKKKNGNVGLIILVIILLILCCGMGTFIFINKDNLLESKSVSVSNNSKNDNNKINICDEINYDLKTDKYGFYVGEGGVNITVDNTRKSAEIFYNGLLLSNNFSLGWVSANTTTSYELLDKKTFDKKISQVLVDGYGQDVTNLSILYLMEDGTIEYVPILKDLETNWNQSDNTKKFNSYGKLNSVSNIISLIPASANGSHTVLARKADGSVIDLADILKATGNYK